MYKGKKIIALIPARGGSKGLPGKNVKPLMGKPLIAWTIEQAKESNYLDKIVVSTDDESIVEISRDYGAEVPFMRPGSIAGDKSPTIDTIMHALDFFKDRGEVFDYLALLEPTSPLRNHGDIDNAIALLIDNEHKADSLVSVGNIHLEHPSIMKIIRDGYAKPYEFMAKRITHRQDLERVYFPYGVIYLSKVNQLLSAKTFYTEHTIPYEIERWQNYEVDDLFDFICIEAIMNYKYKEVITG